MATKPKPKYKGGKRGAMAGAGAVAFAAYLMSQFTPVWEGNELDPYRDATGTWTVCGGETRIEMRRYTEEECAEINQGIYEEFAAHVAETLPSIVDKPFMLAGFGDTAINIGKAGFDRSSMVREYRQGNYREACRALLRYKFSKGVYLNGLYLRRTGDRDRMGAYEFCLADAVEAELRAKGLI